MIFLIILGWLVLSGAAYPLVLNHQVKSCAWDSHYVGKTSKGEPHYLGDREHHRNGAIALSLAGPFVLPFAVGSLLTNRTDAAQSKQAKELAEIKHRKKMVEKEAEILAIQEKNLGIKE